MKKVLVVSNDNNVKLNLEKAFPLNGFIVMSVSKSYEAWNLLQETLIDFVMIDMQMSDESGLSFYKALRQSGSRLPVIMMGEGELDCFTLKDLSIDHYDYILKPLKFSELEVKINNLLVGKNAQDRFMSFGKFKIDYKKQLVIVKDTFFHLSKIEMKIFILLAQKGGGAIDPKKISSILEAEGKQIAMTSFYYVSQLRKKLQVASGNYFDISFVKDQGYRLNAAEA